MTSSPPTKRCMLAISEQLARRQLSGLSLLLPLRPRFLRNQQLAEVAWSIYRDMFTMCGLDTLFCYWASGNGQEVNLFIVPQQGDKSDHNSSLEPLFVLRPRPIRKRKRGHGRLNSNNPPTPNRSPNIPGRSSAMPRFRENAPPAMLPLLAAIAKLNPEGEMQQKLTAPFPALRRKHQG